MGRKVWLDDEEYYKSGRWKCSKSPTGAHHWVELTSSRKVSGMWHCKYCNDVTKFPLTWQSLTSRGAIPALED